MNENERVFEKNTKNQPLFCKVVNFLQKINQIKFTFAKSTFYFPFIFQN